MPAFLAKGVSQHSTQEANDSRLVTKVRWVVEAINALLKKFKGVDGKLANNYNEDDLKMDVKIILAACNAYRPPLAKSREDDEDMANLMLEMSRTSNELEKLVNEKVEGKFGDVSNRKPSMWTQVPDWLDLLEDQAVKDFPLYTLDSFRVLTMGIFQLKNSVSYSFQHRDESGTRDDEERYDVFYHVLQPQLFRVLIQSRHSNAKQYNCWIRYDSQRVTEWYCKCKDRWHVLPSCKYCLVFGVCTTFVSDSR
eukprot:Lithocolla_globosa_v1_NODE_7709_length_910_cov_95.619883.p1 type:complete len:252 gc:universal NODE_7709_length_910_cov_95.619883:765-10(-)